MRGCQDMVCSACTSRGLVSSQTGDVRRKQAGPFQVKAAISACQMAEPAPDWPQTLPLYTVLLTLEPAPVVRVNRAVALAETGHMAAALATLETLREALADFQPFHAAHATVLEKAGDHPAARLDSAAGS